MKKILIVTFTLVFVAAAIIQSCKKDESFIQFPQSKTNHFQLKSAQDTIIQSRIIAFMDRMKLVREDPDYEGSEDWNYSTDSAIWYIEAALNMYFSYYYLYSYDDSSYYISYYDSADVQIDESGGEYNIVEIQESYDYFSAIMDDYYNDSIEGSAKFFIILDITKIENDQVYAKFVFGKRSEILQEYPEYYWGMHLGLCSGGDYGQDAASKLTTYKNLPYHLMRVVGQRTPILLMSLKHLISTQLMSRQPVMRMGISCFLNYLPIQILFVSPQINLICG